MLIPSNLVLAESLTRLKIHNMSYDGNKRVYVCVEVLHLLAF